MRIDRGKTIAGLDSFKLREVFRKWSPERGLKEVFNLRGKKLTNTLSKLNKLGFLSKGSDGWELTIKGNALGMAHASHPFSKPVAEKKLEEFIGRAKLINANDDYKFRVGKISVFGSFLSDAPKINDLDIAVRLDRRFPPDKDLKDISKLTKRAEESGLTFRSFEEMLFYPEKEIRMFLKSRQNIFSIHTDEEVEDMKKDDPDMPLKTVYTWDPSDTSIKPIKLSGMLHDVEVTIKKRRAQLKDKSDCPEKAMLAAAESSLRAIHNGQHFIVPKALKELNYERAAAMTKRDLKLPDSFTIACQGTAYPAVLTVEALHNEYGCYLVVPWIYCRTWRQLPLEWGVFSPTKNIHDVMDRDHFDYLFGDSLTADYIKDTPSGVYNGPLDTDSTNLFHLYCVSYYHDDAFKHPSALATNGISFCFSIPFFLDKYLLPFIDSNPFGSESSKVKDIYFRSDSDVILGVV